MIYLIIFTVCCALMLLEQFLESSWLLRISQYLLVAALIVFIGFRQVGPDFESYRDIFNFPKDIKGNIEVFFLLLIGFFRSFGWSFASFMLFFATLSILIKMYSIEKYSPYFFLSVVLALPVTLLTDMGQIRFALAVSIVWLSIPYLEERNIVKFMLVVLFATLIHTSALVFSVAFFITPIKLKLRYLLLIWVLCYFAGLSLDNDFSGRLVELFAKDTMMEMKIDLYNDGETFVERYTLPLLGTMFKVIIMALLYYSPIKNERLKQIFLNLYFFSGCIFMFFSFSEILTLRLSMYFFAFEAISIPLALYFIKDKSDVVFWLFLIGLVVKSFYQYNSQVFVSYSDMYLPYKNALRNFF